MHYEQRDEFDYSRISLPKRVQASDKVEVLQDITEYLEKHLSLLYAPEEVLPYHGIHHVHQVRENAAKYVLRCHRYGVEVDEYALDHAILCHDLLFGIDPASFHFESREDLAAFYSKNLLLKLGASEEHAAYVAQIILSTKVNVLPLEVEEIIMRAADLDNLVGSYQSVVDQTARLYQEHRLLSRTPVSYSEFVVGSLVHLSGYSWPMLELTPEARTGEGRSRWHQDLAINLQRLYQSTREGDGDVEVQMSSLPIDLRLLSSSQQKLNVLVAANDEQAFKYSQEISTLYQSGALNCPVLIFPSSAVGEIVQ